MGFKVWSFQIFFCLSTVSWFYGVMILFNGFTISLSAPASCRGVNVAIPHEMMGKGALR